MRSSHQDRLGGILQCLHSTPTFVYMALINPNKQQLIDTVGIMSAPSQWLTWSPFGESEGMLCVMIVTMVTLELFRYGR